MTPALPGQTTRSPRTGQASSASPALDSPAGSSGGAVAALEAVHVSLAGRPVLRGVDLTVRPGEVVAVLGPNGSGKSTLIRALVGLVEIESGTASLFDAPLPRFRQWERIGYVPQRVTAITGVPATVREVVSSGRLRRAGLLRPFGRADRAAVAAALEAVGMAGFERRGIGQLSGGQQQRVLIARALAGEPDLLVLDEPMAGVDLPSQLAFAQTLRTLVEQGRTILVVLHELGAVESLIGRAVVLRDGLVAHDGEPPRPLAGCADDPLQGSPASDHDHVHPHPGPTDSSGLMEYPQRRHGRGSGTATGAS